MFFLSLLVGYTGLRVVLLVVFKPDSPVPLAEWLELLWVGVHRDLVVGLAFTLPLLVWFCLLPNRWFRSRWHRVALSLDLWIFGFVQVFLLVAEYYFFEEFRSRFNTVAVDYLLYPHEVFVNISESYPLIAVVVVCGLASLAWLILAARCFPGLWEEAIDTRQRLLCLAGALTASAVLCAFTSLKGARISPDRTLNEIANNGALSFFSAFWTRNLDYSAFYRTLPRDEAYRRVRQLLTEPGTELVETGASIRRRVAGEVQRPRLNVVLILVESLGSEFWGSLGRPGETLTPEMDRLAREEGLLFTNIYASGNRTVRGLEGVLSSFPPLPGDSLVRRDQSDNVETMARLLRRDGYDTVFICGGRGLFDGLRSFALRNGYDRFIERKHFARPAFATIWGVSDEDLFQRSIAEFRGLSETGRPFLGTVLTVSNHKPYTYPAGRIPEDPLARKREHAVKYSDYALGQFFKAARQEAFWTNTIFAVVADHGARVYGSQSVPIHSYEIPLLVVGPAVVPGPRRIPHLGCSLDVAPTILGLLGRPYETLFFGRDLLRGPVEGGRVLLQHNRDIGLYAQERLVTLGLRQVVEVYAGDPKTVNLQRMTAPGLPEQELEKDAMALYQVADDLYVHRRYHIDP